MDELIQHLKEMGFNTYESKVYLSLVQNHPATGYEVSKSSGVPQARAYDTLKTLENRGIVIARQGRPTTYVPISPHDVLNEFEKSYQQSLTFLRDSLPHLNQDKIEPIHHIQGKAACYKYLEERIEQAEKAIFLEIWARDALRLSAHLKDAVDRGVKLHIVGYNNVELDFCHVHQHVNNEGVMERYDNQWLMLTADEEDGMIANLPDANEKTPHIMHTKNQGVVFLIQELVTHNIFFIEVEDTLPDNLKPLYESHLLATRKKLLASYKS